MGSNYVCLQDTKAYSISDKNRIKEIQDHIKILTKFKGMVTFQEEAGVGLLIIEEVAKHIGRNVWVLAGTPERGEPKDVVWAAILNGFLLRVVRVNGLSLLVSIQSQELD